MEVFFIMLLLIPTILIYYCMYILDKHSIKNPENSEKEKEQKIQKVEQKKLILYIMNIFFSVVLVITLKVVFEKAFGTPKILELVLMFIIGISIITKVIGCEKTANILCGIITVPTIVGMMCIYIDSVVVLVIRSI